MITTMNITDARMKMSKENYNQELSAVHRFNLHFRDIVRTDRRIVYLLISM